MGFKFRKSMKMGPVRVNLSKSGVGYSVGGKGARITRTAKGKTRVSAGIPGTGISYSQTLGSGKKKKTASSAKASAETQGCAGSVIKGILYLIGFCFVVGLLQRYGKILLILALVAIAAYLIYFFLRMRSSESVSASENTADMLPEQSHTEPERTSYEIELANRIAQFESELEAIPRAEIPLSDPAPRQLLKDMHEYSFSNITRKTRLDSIFPIVFLDVETTGLYPSKAEIIEVSAIKFDTGMVPLACFTTLCKPKKPIPAEATAINHITDDMVAEAPSFAQIAPALSRFMDGCHIAGHNLDFDLRFVYAHGVTLPTGTRFYDTLDLAHLTIPQGSTWDYKLPTLCSHYGIHRNNAHRSLSDSYATSKLFSYLVFDKTSRQLDDTKKPVPESDTAE